MLTKEQITHFELFGFVVLKQAFSATEMRAIIADFDALLDQERNGQPFPGRKRQSFYGIAEYSPRLIQLIADDRIYTSVEQLLGPDFVWLNSEGNLYVGDTGWHPDDSRLGYPPIKVSMYLDPLTRDSGCLRVIPGSHLPPLHDNLQSIKHLGLAGRDVPAFPCETEPGDIHFMNMNLWHASFGGHTGRRHLAVNFAPAPNTPEQQALFTKNYRNVLELIKQLQYSQPARATTDAFLHSDNPRLQRLAAKWIELGQR